MADRSGNCVETEEAVWRGGGPQSCVGCCPGPRIMVRANEVFKASMGEMVGQSRLGRGENRSERKEPANLSPWLEWRRKKRIQRSSGRKGWDWLGLMFV